LIPSRDEFFNLPKFFEFLEEQEYKNTLSIGKKGFSGIFRKSLTNDEKINIALKNEKHQSNDAIVFYDLGIENSIELSISIDSCFYGDVFIAFRLGIEKDLRLHLNFKYKKEANVYFYLLMNPKNNVSITKNIDLFIEDFPNIRFYVLDYLDKESMVSQSIKINLDRGSGILKLCPGALLLENSIYDGKVLYFYKNNTNISLNFQPKIIKVCEKGRTSLSFCNAKF